MWCAASCWILETDVACWRELFCVDKLWRAQHARLSFWLCELFVSCVQAPYNLSEGQVGVSYLAMGIAGGQCAAARQQTLRRPGRLYWCPCLLANLQMLALKVRLQV
jgi:hypothetical protein